jgi:hypothetical protein
MVTEMPQRPTVIRSVFLTAKEEMIRASRISRNIFEFFELKGVIDYEQMREIIQFRINNGGTN